MKCNSVRVSPIILLLLFLVIISGCNTGAARKVPFVIVQHASDIRPIEDLSRVPLILYDNRIDLDQFPVEEKKSLFIRMMLPSVLAVYEDYQQAYKRVDEVLSTYHFTGLIQPSDSLWLDPLTEEMHARDYWDLRRRLKPNPVSITLAQAAIESGWGTSRMFLRANNVFGVWSFDPEEPRIRANATRNGRPVFLREYSSVEESVGDYMRIFSTVAVYERFRSRRLNENDPAVLARSLTAYSEQGIQYAAKVIRMIRQNDLQQYDSARLDEAFTAPSVFRF